MKKLAKSLAIVLLIVMSLALLVSCGPNSDPDKALASLKKNEFVAGKATDAFSLGVVQVAIGASNGDITAIVSGSKVAKDDENNTKGDSITIIYFKDGKTADKLWTKIEEYANEKNEDKESDWVIKKSGAMVYFGTKGGVKAAA